jgi:hypothetical protein
MRAGDMSQPKANLTLVGASSLESGTDFYLFEPAAIKTAEGTGDLWSTPLRTYGWRPSLLPANTPLRGRAKI